jgi:hypothetical protein
MLYPLRADVILSNRVRNLPRLFARFLLPNYFDRKSRHKVGMQVLELSFTYVVEENKAKGNNDHWE